MIIYLAWLGVTNKKQYQLPLWTMKKFKNCQVCANNTSIDSFAKYKKYKHTAVHSLNIKYDHRCTIQKLESIKSYWSDWNQWDFPLTQFKLLYWEMLGVILTLYHSDHINIFTFCWNVEWIQYSFNVQYRGKTNIQWKLVFID